MERNSFEQSCSDANARRDSEVAAARATGSACSITPMLAFGGIDYCTTHRVMGPCPYGKGGAR